MKHKNLFEQRGIVVDEGKIWKVIVKMDGRHVFKILINRIMAEKIIIIIIRSMTMLML